MVAAVETDILNGVRQIVVAIYQPVVVFLRPQMKFGCYMMFAFVPLRRFGFKPPHQRISPFRMAHQQQMDMIDAAIISKNAQSVVAYCALN